MESSSKCGRLRAADIDFACTRRAVLASLTSAARSASYVRRARDPYRSDAAHADHRPRQRGEGRRRARAPAGGAPRDPLLVVPTAADVEHYQRELAASGIVFGAEVLDVLRGSCARSPRRAGLDARPLGRVARDRVVRAAIADVPLRALARSAATPGFAAAAGALFAELQRSLVTPARFTSALRAWAGGSGAGTAQWTAAAGGGRRTPASSARSTRPTGAGSSGSGGPTRRATRGRRSTRCAPPPAPGAAGRCSSTASTTSRRSSATPSRRSCATRAPTCSSRSPTSPAASRSPAAPRPSRSCGRSRPRSCRCPSAPSTTRRRARPALHHLERSLFEPEPGPAPARTARCGCWRRAASAPRPSWSAPPCSS